jgi:ABC-type cobalamin/Fe3+-siderophores transport system ATPase subunit
VRLVRGSWLWDGFCCSGGERRILLLSTSLAAGTPVSLRDTITSLDENNIARLITAIRHAAGRRSETAITARLVMAKSSHSTDG